MAIADYFNGPKYKNEIIQLKAELNAIENQKINLIKEKQKLEKIMKENGSLSIHEISQKIEYSELELKKINNNINAKQAMLNEIELTIKEKQSQILVLEESILLENFALYLPKFKLISSDEYKIKLENIREQQKSMIKNETAAYGNLGWTVNNSQAEGRKLVKDMIKLILRAFNNECDYCVDNVKFTILKIMKNE